MTHTTVSFPFSFVLSPLFPSYLDLRASPKLWHMVMTRTVKGPTERHCVGTDVPVVSRLEGRPAAFSFSLLSPDFAPKVAARARARVCVHTTAMVVVVMWWQ